MCISSHIEFFPRLTVPIRSQRPDCNAAGLVAGGREIPLYGRSAFHGAQRSASCSRHEWQAIIHGSAEILFASDVALSRLNGCVSQKELDLFQFATSGVTQTGARPPQIMRRERLDISSVCAGLHDVPNHLGRPGTRLFELFPCYTLPRLNATGIGNHESGRPLHPDGIADLARGSRAQRFQRISRLKCWLMGTHACAVSEAQLIYILGRVHVPIQRAPRGPWEALRASPAASGDHRANSVSWRRSPLAFGSPTRLTPTFCWGRLKQSALGSAHLQSDSADTMLATRPSALAAPHPALGTSLSY